MCVGKGEIMTEENNIAVENQNDNQNEAGKEQTGISFKDQSELDSFVDTKLNKALETAHSKWEEEAKEREDKAKQLAKMTEAERIKAQQKERDEALSKREHDLQMREYSIQAKSTLAEVGLPNSDELVSLVLSDDVEKTSNNITYLKEVIAEAVNKRVDELSNQTTPKESGSLSKTKTTDFAEIARNSRII